MGTIVVWRELSEKQAREAKLPEGHAHGTHAWLKSPGKKERFATMYIVERKTGCGLYMEKPEGLHHVCDTDDLDDMLAFVQQEHKTGLLYFHHE